VVDIEGGARVIGSGFLRAELAKGCKLFGLFADRPNGAGSATGGRLLAALLGGVSGPVAPGVRMACTMGTQRMDERPGLPDRDEAGRFLLSDDPMVSVGVRIPTSYREKLRATARAKGKQPTVMARWLLLRAIQDQWAQTFPKEAAAEAAAEAAQRIGCDPLQGTGRRSK
jgi:hypothetical protein